MLWNKLLALGLALGMPAPAPRATPPPPVVARTSWSALALPASLVRLLETGRWDRTLGGFRIIALSFTADGCVAEARRDSAKSEAALACVDRCLEIARLSHRGFPALDGDEGLWLSHYNLLLGARDALGACAEPTRHEAISRALARRTLQSPTRHLASYPNASERWPADQTATLASLARYDHAHAAELSEAPRVAWREWMLAHAMSRKLGLPFSEITGTAIGRDPRGCALSYQTRYLKEFDEPLARDWWQQYRRLYLIERAGLVGLREWPPGRERAGDVDAGPVVQGVGAAATGLAIAAARSMGDDGLAARLQLTAAFVDSLVGTNPTLRHLAHAAIADAVRYVGAQVRAE
jgi:hypothetical protein